MSPLPPELRRDLEKAVVAARGLAESAAKAALARLGAEDAEPPAGLSPDLRGLRTALRERAKALGGGVRSLGVPLLVEEIAYEQWHRMLFARFLAENDLLLHPEGAPVSLADVRELAAEEGERDPWVLAARYAAAMLPGIFRADDPANRVPLAPEDRSRLEAVLERLPSSLFTADDALGWVYQFWQSERKDEVNKRGDKIGGADLPPMTQLFTEHYMVRFLLENSLGAWWAGRHPDSPLLREWEYLRFRDDGTPAAGTFEGWPSRVAEVTVVDPCCGSGHFLTAAADILRRMRAEEEGLTPAQAAVAVIRDNLFGLELDARCLQLAAFNLALDAWKAGGHQPLPIPNLACSGIAIKGQRADWHRLAGDDANMADALDRLYDLFQDAPELGSLIDPRSAAGDGLWAVDPEELLAKLDRALQRETASDPAAAVFGAAAAGTAKAAQLLAGHYWLVATNPPYLARRKQGETLRQHLHGLFRDAETDLATAFVLRCLEVATIGGTTALLTPQNWLYVTSYTALRRHLLVREAVRLLASVGSGATSTASWEVTRALTVIDRTVARPDARVSGVAVTTGSIGDRDAGLAREPVASVTLSSLMSNPDARFALRASTTHGLLRDHAASVQGMATGDTPRFVRMFWECIGVGEAWERLLTSPTQTGTFGGRSQVVFWEDGVGTLDSSARLNRASLHDSHRRGSDVWGRRGVAVGQMRDLPWTMFEGELFDSNVAAVVPAEGVNLPALVSYAASEEFRVRVREIDPKLAVTNSTLTKVPFDLEHWTRVAAEQYPDGLPEPHSDDPTQWLFKGTIPGSEAPLQVAVARLLGYRWPDQEPDELDLLADEDGLVPLVSVSGERPAAERLRALLARAYGDAWSPALLERLLTEAGSPGATLETWLRDDFFAQHVKLFAQRPFIWHVWDGRKDGFSVLCHYHRLDRARLERLTYTLLGDWIERQRAAGDEPGAEARLSAALGLQEKLAAIVVGEAPNDIYVRWKSLAEQPLGWEPDLDDGVRLNIRPFVTASGLRARVNVKWDKDRGKNPDGSERINDLHPTLAEKRAARAAAEVG
jgi:hypothetical protein